MNDLFETVATLFLAAATLALLGLVALMGYLIYSLFTTGVMPG